ncbi:MAG: tRNA pseudouridine(38-40) synthase TruA [Thermoplasmata archaeon]|nr:tRNA pseudouridine(38-40) synthase TruA [Thermoplasmata archaeon]
MRIAVKFGYDGTLFHGYQRQKNAETVEGKILNFLLEKQILIEKPGFASASRTDAGVSALGNVIAFNTMEKPEKILGMLNTVSDAIWFLGYAIVPEKFNPRHAKERWYRYFLSKRNWRDRGKLEQALSVFTGVHDFRNFARPSERKTLREIFKIDVSDADSFWVIDLHGTSFLWGMARKIIGAVEELATGRITEHQILEALNARTSIDFPLAPPEFLILMDVRYDFEFVASETVKRRLQKKIEKKFRTLVVENEIYRNLRKMVSGSFSPE